MLEWGQRSVLTNECWIQLQKSKNGNSTKWINNKIIIINKIVVESHINNSLTVIVTGGNAQFFMQQSEWMKPNHSFYYQAIVGLRMFIWFRWYLQYILVLFLYIICAKYCLIVSYISKYDFHNQELHFISWWIRKSRDKIIARFPP